MSLRSQEKSAQTAVQSQPPDIVTLELGKGIERELSGGQSHWYQVVMAEGQYLQLVVDQRGIDVVVALHGPDGPKLTEIDSPNGASGTESLNWIAGASGPFRIEVRSLEKDAKAGKYEVKIQTLRQATTEDNHRVKAEKSYAEGFALAAEGTAVSLRRALEKFSEAIIDWRAAGEREREAATLSYLARVYYDLGEKQKALEYYNLALPIYRQAGDQGGEATTLNDIGAIYYSQGENQKALEHYNQALVIRRQVGNRNGEAGTLNNIGVAYYSLGENQKALEYYKQALPIYQKVGNRGGEATTLGNIGSVYSSLGEKQKALEYFDQALPVIRLVGDRRGEARTLSNIGGVYSSLGEKQKALDYYTRALTIRRQVADRNGEGTTLNDIGLVYDSLGEKQKALEYYSQALSIRRQVGDRGGEATTLNNIGFVYASLGENQKALEYYSQSLPIIRQVGNRLVEAATLNNIGLVYATLGENQKALEYFSQALPIIRRVRDRGGEVRTLNNIGGVYDNLGEKQKALEYYSQALPIYRQVGDRSGEAGALNNIGVVYDDLGENQKALEYYNQALPLYRQVNDPGGEATTFNNIGFVYSSLGEKQKALEYFSQALRIYRQVGNRRGEATTRDNIGTVYSSLGENQKALEYHSHSLTIIRQVGDRRAEAGTLNNIGLVYSSLGEKQKALEYFSQALPIIRHVGDRGGEAATLKNLASVNGDRGRLQEARTNIETALAIVESLRTSMVRQELRSSYSSSVHGFHEFYIDLLMRMHKDNPLSGIDSTALNASERGRARSLLELLNESHANIKQGVDPSLLERERSIQQLLDAKAQRLTRLLSGAHTEEQAAAARKEVEDLAEEFHVVQAQIREKSPRYAALTQPQPLSLEQIQKLLDSDTLLLEYSLGPERSYLWMVAQGSYKSYELPKASEIQAAAKQFYDSLRSPGAVRKGPRRRTRSERVYTAESLRQAEALSRKLSAMLLSPVASMLGDKRLVVIPDGALQYLPFGALADPSRPAKLEPLILRHEIVSLPSASALAVQRNELDGRKPAPKRAVVLADPVFSADDRRIGRDQKKRSSLKVDAARQDASEDDEPLYRLAITRALRDAGHRSARDALARLPGTRLEGEEIVALAGKDQSKLIVDFAASRAAAESEELSQYRYVHFATHGLLDSSNSELSALVLSLVNEEGQDQDGYLRAHQIFNLNLPAEVVVLSACETGLGKDVRGEGLVGITRAFMYAGARRVVVSLWSVNDRSTAELMTNFYRGMLEDGTRPAAALRTAQIKMLTDPKMKHWRSPYYWAPFVLQGEWR